LSRKVVIDSFVGLHSLLQVLHIVLYRRIVHHSSGAGHSLMLCQQIFGLGVLRCCSLGSDEFLIFLALFNLFSQASRGTFNYFFITVLL